MWFLQRAVGYSLTADIREQCFFLLYGAGSNGKSTFIKTISALFADYARTTPVETLLVRHGNNIPNDVARLKGARFVSAVETEGGKRLAESLVKQLTGGDKVAARFLHREFFEFEPTFKLWLAVNHKPKIRGTDHAIWRRIRLIPFTVTIPDSEQDKDLPEKLREELPGILRWAVEGCLWWQRDGLGTPEVVKAATAGYQTEMDVVGNFLAECTESENGATVTTKELYDSYMRWCEQAGEKPITKRDLGTHLSERGFESARNWQGRFWQGLSLRKHDT
jgi:putative DNA primase/helicase